MQLVPSMSRAEALKKARADKAAVFAASKNSAHVAAKYMMDIDLLDNARIIMSLGTPVQEEHSAAKILLTSPAEASKCHVNQATLGDWVQTLVKTVRLLSDKHCLKRCGVSLDTAAAREAKPPESELAYQKQVCEKIFSFAVNILSERCGSMFLQCQSYPDALYGLLSDREEQRKSTLKQFEEDWDAYATARRLGEPSLKKELERSPMDTRLMQDFARLARHARWDIRSAAPLISRVREAAKCFGQENLIELSFKESKDRATRDSTSRSVRNWRAYESLLNSGLEQRFGMEALDSSAVMPLSQPSALREADDFLFSRPGESPSHTVLHRITGDTTWATPNPLTKTKIPGDIFALRQLRQKNSYALGKNLFINSLVPRHQAPILL